MCENNVCKQISEPNLIFDALNTFHLIMQKIYILQGQDHVIYFTYDKMEAWRKSATY